MAENNNFEYESGFNKKSNEEENIDPELRAKFDQYKLYLADLEILGCIIMIVGYLILIKASISDKEEIYESSRGLKITVDPATLTEIAYNYILVAITLLYIVAVKRTEQRTREINYGLDVEQTDINFRAIAIGYGIDVIANIIRTQAATNIANISGEIETFA